MKKRVLLVEDDAIIAMGQQAELNQYGYSVLTAYSGEQAVAEYRRNAAGIDLVLMDIDLGSGMDGTQAAQQILDEHEVPVVFLSNHTEPEIVEKTERITSFGYVVKNSGITVLDASIKMACRLFEEKQRVRASENQFHQLFNSMREGVAIYRAVEGGDNFEFVDLNPAGLAATGRGSAEVVGRRVTDVFPGVVGMGLLDVLREVYQTGNSRELPVTFYTDDKIGFWVENYVFRLPSGQLVAIFADVSERYNTARALQESERRYRNLVENMNEIVFSLDTGGCFTFVSSAAQKIAGYAPETLTGQPFVDYVHPDDLPALAANYQRVLDGEIVGSEYRVRKRDGQYLWVRSESSSLVEDGRVVGIQGFLQDMDERRKTRDQLFRSEARFRDLADMLPVGVFELDREFRVTYTNQKGLEMTGYAEQDLQGGLQAVHMLTPEFRDAALKAGERSLQGRQRDAHEYTCLRKDGSTFPALIQASLIERDGLTAGIRGVFIDISEQKAYKEELESQRWRLSAIIEGTNAGVWEWDVQTGEVAVNERCAEMLGYTVEELSPITIQTWRDHTHPEDLQRSDELIKQHLRGKSAYYECEVRLIHKNGHYVRVLDRAKVSSWTEDGKPRRVFGTHTDISAVGQQPPGR